MVDTLHRSYKSFYPKSAPRAPARGALFLRPAPPAPPRPCQPWKSRPSISKPGTGKVQVPDGTGVRVHPTHQSRTACTPRWSRALPPPGLAAAAATRPWSRSRCAAAQVSSSRVEIRVRFRDPVPAPAGRANKLRVDPGPLPGIRVPGMTRATTRIPGRPGRAGPARPTDVAWGVALLDVLNSGRKRAIPRVLASVTEHVRTQTASHEIRRPLFG